MEDQSSEYQSDNDKPVALLEPGKRRWHVFKSKRHAEEKESSDKSFEAPPQANQLVWQWLTYGLWSWTLIALGSLMSLTLTFFIVSRTNSSLSDQNWMVYIIAAVACLLPPAFLIDRYYSRFEPATKHGFAAFILVIHAVLAFLVGIGSLITGVITLLSLATDIETRSNVKWAVIASAFLIACLAWLFFIRIVRPDPFRRLAGKFRKILVVVTLITIIAALAGPYVAAVGSRGDRLIESGLDSVVTAVNQYASNNGKLPNSLSQLHFSSYDNVGQALVNSGKVQYRKLPGSTTCSPTGIEPAYPVRIGTKYCPAIYCGGANCSTVPNSYYDRNYELCVDYKYQKGDGTMPDTTGYGYVDTTDHPAGHACYKFSAGGPMPMMGNEGGASGGLKSGADAGTDTGTGTGNGGSGSGTVKPVPPTTAM